MSGTSKPISVRSLDDVRRYAYDLTGDQEQIEQWIDRPLKIFEDRTVRQMVEQEEWDRLEAMFHRLLTGEPY